MPVPESVLGAEAAGFCRGAVGAGLEEGGGGAVAGAGVGFGAGRMLVVGAGVGAADAVSTPAQREA
jgi:hypothetical protein